MSNEKSDEKEGKIVFRHIISTRCPKCGQFYFPQDGHKCKKTDTGQKVKKK